MWTTTEQEDRNGRAHEALAHKTPWGQRTQYEAGSWSCPRPWHLEHSRSLLRRGNKTQELSAKWCKDVRISPHSKSKTFSTLELCTKLLQRPISACYVNKKKTKMVLFPEVFITQKKHLITQTIQRFPPLFFGLQKNQRPTDASMEVNQSVSLTCPSQWLKTKTNSTSRESSYLTCQLPKFSKMGDLIDRYFQRLFWIFFPIATHIQNIYSDDFRSFNPPFFLLSNALRHISSQGEHQVRILPKTTTVTFLCRRHKQNFQKRRKRTELLCNLGWL